MANKDRNLDHAFEIAESELGVNLNFITGRTHYFDKNVPSFERLSSAWRCLGEVNDVMREVRDKAKQYCSDDVKKAMKVVDLEYTKFQEVIAPYLAMGMPKIPETA